MDLTLSLNKNFNLPIYNNLEKLYTYLIFSNDHTPKFRHPADIFFRRFEDISKSLDNLMMFIDKDDDEGLETTLKRYLLSLDTFYDNLYNIIMCLKESTDKLCPNAIQWLKLNNHKEGDKLSGSTMSHHKVISTIVNKIKHDDPELNPISFTWDGGTKINGFFIASILDGGTIGADTDIHTPYKGLSTGYSFNHFLLKTIGMIYLYSYQLNSIIFNNKKDYTDNKVSEFYKPAEFAAQIDTVFFPDEYNKPTANIKKTTNKIIITYPFKYSSKKPKKLAGNVNVLNRFNKRTGKGAIKIPYFGKPIR